MRRRAGYRKVNYASYVKRTMPVATVSPAVSGQYNRQYSTNKYTPTAGKVLDNTLKW